MLCFIGISFILLGVGSIFLRNLFVERAQAEASESEQSQAWESRLTCGGLIAILLGIIIILAAPLLAMR